MEPIQISATKVQFNGDNFYFDGRYYTRQMLVKGKLKRCMLHRIVWEYHNGPISDKKMHVHHMDENVHNNSISNLQLIHISQHLHHHMMKPERREFARKNMLEVVHPAAAAWHHSEAGRANHKRVAEETGFVTNRPTLDYICEECGATFTIMGYKKTTKVSRAKYCGLNCKMRAFRRRKKNPMNAVDMETATQKECIFCGIPYMTNRPDQSKYCSPSCTRKAYHAKKKLEKG